MHDEQFFCDLYQKTFEVMESGSARSADYEIVNIYGRKYIVFSSGGDIEVLNY